LRAVTQVMRIQQEVCFVEQDASQTATVSVIPPVSVMAIVGDLAQMQVTFFAYLQYC